MSVTASVIVFLLSALFAIPGAIAAALFVREREVPAFGRVLAGGADGDFYCFAVRFGRGCWSARSMGDELGRLGCGVLRAWCGCAIVVLTDPRPGLSRASLVM